MKINFSEPKLTKNELKNTDWVLKNNWILNGPKNKSFELLFNKKFKIKYSTTVSSCTAGLEMALAALNLNYNDEIIMSSFNFIAAGLAALKTKAKIIFIDLKKNSFDINLQDLKKNINKNTKCIILTHYNGYAQPLKEISKIIKKKKIKIIEDCAHSLGSKYFNSNYIGSKSFAAIFSFGPTKLITSGGAGGMVVSNNKSFIKKIVQMKSFGMEKNSFARSQLTNPWTYKINLIGGNFRMTEIQAIIGMEQFKKLDKKIRKRNQMINLYKKYLNNKFFSYQERKSFEEPSVLYFILILHKSKLRNRLIYFLKKNNITASVHWENLLTDFKIFSHLKKGQTNNAKDISSKIISLPLHFKMTNNQIIRISKKINEFFKENN